MKYNPKLACLFAFCQLYTYLYSVAGIAPASIPEEHPNLYQLMLADSTEAKDVYTPGLGFRLVDSKYGAVNFKIYSYIRYVNQLGLDDTYEYKSGSSIDVKRRQDIQVSKVNLQFLGWIMDPKLRYIFYTWTNNTAQGQSAQVVVAGNVSYNFCEQLTLGGGIYSLPGTRSTEGNFPYWLTNDNRSIADEFFRPSYTTGIFAKGTIAKGLTYNTMLGNNLSQLGIDAGQLDNQLSTFAFNLAWCPTTGEFGKYSAFGDFDQHEKVATRVGAKFTESREDRQGVPTSDAFDNVTIRLSDGTVIFAPDALGAGVQLDKATYIMGGFDAGVKYHGLSLEAEYYVRNINSFRGTGIDSLPFSELNDNGFQVMASGMVLDKQLQLYAITSSINGEYGNPWEWRGGLNWFPWKNYVVRFNLEYMYVNHSPVGGLSLPYPVGATGSIFRADMIVNF